MKLCNLFDSVRGNSFLFFFFFPLVPSLSLLLSFSLPLSLPLCLFFFSSPFSSYSMNITTGSARGTGSTRNGTKDVDIKKWPIFASPRKILDILGPFWIGLIPWLAIERPLMRAANISSIPGWLLRISKNRSKYRIGYEMNFSLHIGTHKGRGSSSFSMNAMMTEKFPIFPSRFKRIILDRAKILFFFYHSSRMKNGHGDLINRNHDKNTESAE